MKVYITDDIFVNDVTNYTGEEMIEKKEKISLKDLLKLKKEGISYTKDPDKAGHWIKEIERKTERDFGGIMIKNFRHTRKFKAKDYDWDKIRKLKQDKESQKDENSFKSSLKVETNSKAGSDDVKAQTTKTLNSLENDDKDLTE